MSLIIITDWQTFCSFSSQTLLIFSPHSSSPVGSSSYNSHSSSSLLLSTCSVSSLSCFRGLVGTIGGEIMGTCLKGCILSLGVVFACKILKNSIIHTFSLFGCLYPGSIVINCTETVIILSLWNTLKWQLFTGSDTFFLPFWIGGNCRVLTKSNVISGYKILHFLDQSK